MKAFFTLCRIEIIALLSAMNLRGRKREKAFAAPVAALLAGGLMAYIGVAYALPMALTLIPMLMGDLYWGQMVLMAFILCLSLTVMAGSGMLFGGKDMDFLFALPLSARTVLAAKLLALYLENVFLTLCMLLPSGIVYAMQTVFSPSLALGLVVVSLFLPMFTTAISGLVGFISSAIASRSRHKNLLAALGGLVAFVLLMAAILTLQTSLTNETRLLAIRQALWDYLPPLHWVCSALAGQGMLPLLWFALLCGGCLALFVGLLAPFYQPLVLRLASRSQTSRFVMKRQTSGSALSALYRKEAARFFGSPVYLLNCGIGTLMLVIGGGYLAFQARQIRQLVQLSGITPDEATLLLAVAVAFCGLLCPPSAVSLSLEGKSLWLLQTAPLSPAAILGMKALFSVTVLLPGSLAILIGGQIALGLPLVNLAVVVLAAVACLVFGPLLGVFLNLLLPRLDAPNDTIVVKQSGSVMICVFLTMGLIGLLVIAFAIFQPPALAYLVACSLALLAASGGLLLYLLRRGNALFAALGEK